MPLYGQLEEPLPPVVGPGTLQHELLAHQMAENPAEALLGDAENAEQLADRDLRMAADEMDHPVMGAAETVARENGIGLRRKVAVGKE